MNHAGPALTPSALPEIPDKLYFRIGEVSHLVGVEPYVLRYWESEFPTLAPKKSGTGHRLYRRKEVEMVLELKRLLYEKRFTIEGARLYLDQNRKRAKAMSLPTKGKRKGRASKDGQPQGDLFNPGVPVSAIAEIKEELGEILKMLR